MASYSTNKIRNFSHWGTGQRGGELTLGQALQGSQSLATVSLLDTDVDVVLLGPNLRCVIERVSLVGEGVYKGGNKHMSVTREESMEERSKARAWRIY